MGRQGERMGRQDEPEEDNTPVPSMRSTVWVGRVKSNVAPELLDNAFAKYGRIRKVDTGFAGFAFVEYENEDDADRACEEMNKFTIVGIGEIRVSKATYRGYQDACQKRCQYWRVRGGKDTNPSWCQGAPAHGRDNREAPRHVRSGSRRRGRESLSHSQSRSRSRSRSKAGSTSRRRCRTRTWSRSQRDSASRSRTSQGTEGSQRRTGRLAKTRIREGSASKSRAASPSERSLVGSPEQAAEVPELNRVIAEAKDVFVEEKIAPVQEQVSDAGEVGKVPESELRKSGVGHAAKTEPLGSSDGSPAKQQKGAAGRAAKTSNRRKSQGRAKGKGSQAAQAQAQTAEREAAATEEPLPLALVAPEATDDEEGAQLSCADRAAVVCFFDGANACDLLLEGSAVLRLPDFYIPYLLNGFPHGFQGLSQEDSMKLLDVLAGIARGDNRAERSRGSEPSQRQRSTEVRQTLLVDSRGRRIMRKSLVINGEEVCSEEQII